MALGSMQIALTLLFFSLASSSAADTCPSWQYLANYDPDPLLSAGTDFSCFINSDGDLKCWGRNDAGQLGQGSFQSIIGARGETIAPIDVGSNRYARTVQAGNQHACAVLDDGSVKCWGANGSGQLGQGDTLSRGSFTNSMGDRLPPVNLGTTEKVKSVTVGADHTCVLLDGGSIKCWGRNDFGQLGIESDAEIGKSSATMGTALASVDLGTESGKRKNATAISAGQYHTCAILETLELKCWGANSAGELGLGDAVNRGTEEGSMGDKLPAVFVTESEEVYAVGVYAGGQTTCVRLNTNQAALKCWGEGLDGSLGQGDTIGRGTQAGDMEGLPAVDLGARASVATAGNGRRHVCAVLDDGALKCWGRNEEGQLGLDDNRDRGTGEFGMGDSLDAVGLGEGAKAEAVASGWAHTCVLLDSDFVRCFGDNAWGQLGMGLHAGSSLIGDQADEMGDSLAQVMLGTSVLAAEVSAGNWYSTCAVSSAKKVYCWGNNNDEDALAYGLLGLEDSVNRGPWEYTMHDALPEVNLGDSLLVEEVRVGYQHSCARFDDGSVKCWGVNNVGQLGIESTISKGGAAGEMGGQLPTVNLGTGEKAAAIMVGNGFTCALLLREEIKCWGKNLEGQLGQGSTTGRGLSVGSMGDELPTVNLGSNPQGGCVSKAGAHACAILAAGELKCWGRNSRAQLGVNTNGSPVGTTAEQMGSNLQAVSLGAVLSVIEVSCGTEHTCALLDTEEGQQLKCWGGNSDGQLGYEDFADRGSNPANMGSELPPVDLGSGRFAVGVAAGEDHTCAVLDNDELKCWGRNLKGQLGYEDTRTRGGTGDPTMGDVLPRVNLGSNRKPLKISAGNGHTCAVLNDNNIKCWGQNQFGQTGRGYVDIAGDDSGETVNIPFVQYGAGGGDVADYCTNCTTTACDIGFERLPCLPETDSQCFPCVNGAPNCEPGQSYGFECTCLTCTKCVGDQWESKPCTTTENRVCSQCSELTCDSGQFLRPCNGTHDSACIDCPGPPAGAELIPGAEPCTWECIAGYKRSRDGNSCERDGTTSPYVTTSSTSPMPPTTSSSSTPSPSSSSSTTAQATSSTTSALKEPVITSTSSSSTTAFPTTSTQDAVHQTTSAVATTSTALHEPTAFDLSTTSTALHETTAFDLSTTSTALHETTAFDLSTTSTALHETTTSAALQHHATTTSSAAGSTSTSSAAHTTGAATTSQGSTTDGARTTTQGTTATKTTPSGVTLTSSTTDGILGTSAVTSSLDISPTTTSSLDISPTTTSSGTSTRQTSTTLAPTTDQATSTSSGPATTALASDVISSTNPAGMSSSLGGSATTAKVTTSGLSGTTVATTTPSPTVFVDFVATLGMTAEQFSPEQDNFMAAVTDAVVLDRSQASITEMLDASQLRRSSSVVAVTTRLETTESDADRVKGLLTVENLNRFLAQYGLSVLGLQIVGEGSGCPIGLMTVQDPRPGATEALCLPCVESLCPVGHLLQCSLTAFNCTPCAAHAEYVNFTAQGSCEWECADGFMPADDGGESGEVCIDEDWKEAEEVFGASTATVVTAAVAVTVVGTVVGSVVTTSVTGGAAGAVAVGMGGGVSGATAGSVATTLGGTSVGVGGAAGAISAAGTTQGGGGGGGSGGREASGHKQRAGTGSATMALLQQVQFIGIAGTVGGGVGVGQPAEAGEVSRSVAWANMHIIPGLPSSCPAMDRSYVELWATVLSFLSSWAISAAVRLCVNAMVPRVLRRMGKEPPQGRSILLAPAWDLVIFYAGILGLSESVGYAIGSGCGDYIGGGIAVLALLFGMLVAIAYVIWHGAIQQGFVRFERIPWAESKAAFQEAWSHRKDSGAMGWLASMQVRVEALQQLTIRGAWNDELAEEEVSKGRHKWMHHFLLRYGPGIEGYSEWWVGLWGIGRALVVGLVLGNVTEQVANGSSILAVYTLDLLLWVAFFPSDDRLVAITTAFASLCRVAQLSLTLAFMTGAIDDASKYTTAFFLTSLVGLVPLAVQSIFGGVAVLVAKFGELKTTLFSASADVTSAALGSASGGAAVAAGVALYAKDVHSEVQDQLPGTPSHRQHTTSPNLASIRSAANPGELEGGPEQDSGNLNRDSGSARTLGDQREMVRSWSAREPGAMLSTPSAGMVFDLARNSAPRPDSSSALARVEPRESTGTFDLGVQV